MKNEMWKNALMNIDEKYIAEASEYAPEEEKAPENAVFIGNSPKNSSSRKSTGNIWFVVASAVAVIGCIIGVNAVFGGKEAEINVSSPSSNKVYDIPETTTASAITEVPVTTTVALTYETTTDFVVAETEVTTVTLDIDYIKSEQERIDEILTEQQGNIEKIIESLENEIALLKENKEALEMHIRHYEAEIDDLEEMVEVLTAQKEASETEEDKENLQNDIDDLQEEIKRLEGVIDAYNVAVEDIEETIASYEKQIEEYREELDTYEESKSHLIDMYFVSPVERPDKITTYYGYDEWTGGTHSGIDYGWEDCYGSDISATAEGTVKEVADLETAGITGDGNYIIIDHGNGIETFYAHCSEILAKEGEAVKQGQVIAKIGSTGFSTGPHLHYELRVNGEPVDPTPYFLAGTPCIPALSLASPVDKAKDRVTEYFGGYEGHNGMDFAWDGCYGAHVYASESGTVTFTGWDDRLGNYIIIDHGLAKTVYAQLSSIYVKEGQEVGKSDVIGSIGNTGTVTGSHLHFELIIDGEYSDPTFYMSDFNPNAQG